jgi:hypothetical protein
MFPRDRVRFRSSRLFIRSTLPFEDRCSYSGEGNYAVRDPFAAWGPLAASWVSMLLLLVPRHLGVLLEGFSTCVTLKPFVVATREDKESTGITATVLGRYSLCPMMTVAVGLLRESFMAILARISSMQHFNETRDRYYRVRRNLHVLMVVQVSLQGLVAHFVPALRTVDTVR